MEENNVMRRLYGIGIIPAIVLEKTEDAAPLAHALCNGGLPAAEVTFRTDCAYDAMIAMKRECPQLIVGAGTVLTREQVDSALDAGAEFIVSPGLNPEIVAYCQKKNVPVIPGLATASEIEQALSLGLHTVKFFPAEALGGIETIKALCGPYRNITFLPTGGVNADNMLEYLSFDKVFAVGGTWMVKSNLIHAGRFDEVERLCQEAVRKMLGVHIKHIGINSDEVHGEQIAESFAKMMLGNVRETSKGYFGSELIEVMTHGGPGTYGHICLGVHSVERAVSYYRTLGYSFDESSFQYDAMGHLKFTYFKDEIGGFAVHFSND